MIFQPPAAVPSPIAAAQEQQQAADERDVAAGDHQRVIGAGAPEVLDPGAADAAFVAQKESAHHALAVVVARIQAVDASQAGGPEPLNQALPGRAADARQDARDGVARR